MYGWRNFGSRVCRVRRRDCRRVWEDAKDVADMRVGCEVGMGVEAEAEAEAGFGIELGFGNAGGGGEEEKKRRGIRANWWEWAGEEEVNTLFGFDVHLPRRQTLVVDITLFVWVCEEVNEVELRCFARDLEARLACGSYKQFEAKFRNLQVDLRLILA